MKKLLYILPLAAAVMLSSCGKDDDDKAPAGGGTAAAGTMRATVDGTVWNSGAGTMITTMGGGFNLMGSQMQGQTSSQTIVVRIEQASGVGTFTGDNVIGEYSIANLSTGATQNWSSEDNATVTITKWEGGKASGTFSFVATPDDQETGNKNVTSGSFTDVAIQQ